MVRTVVKSAAAIVAMTLACAALSACGQSADVSGTGSDSQKAPTFSGPYASDFAKEYADAPNDLARGILADGSITEQEIQEIYDQLNKCLEPYGLQSSFSLDLGVSTVQFRGSMSDDEQTKVTEQCDAKTGAESVSSLYSTMHDNPDHLDGEAMARKTYQCLAQHDLLPKPIGEDEYWNTLTTHEGQTPAQSKESNRLWREFFSEYMESTEDGQPNPNYDKNKAQQFWQCNQDPLNQ
jgi:hypothetical protein